MIDSILGDIANIDFNILTPWDWDYEFYFDNGSLGFLVTALVDENVELPVSVSGPSSLLLRLSGITFLLRRKVLIRKSD